MTESAASEDDVDAGAGFETPKEEPRRPRACLVRTTELWCVSSRWVQPPTHSRWDWGWLPHPRAARGGLPSGRSSSLGGLPSTWPRSEGIQAAGLALSLELAWRLQPPAYVLGSDPAGLRASRTVGRQLMSRTSTRALQRLPPSSAPLLLPLSPLPCSAIH